MTIRVLSPPNVAPPLGAVLIVVSAVNGVQAAADVFDSSPRIILAVNATAEGETGRKHEETGSADAHAAYLEGWARYRLFTPGDFAEAIRHFERAIQLDPDDGRAHAALALVHVEGWLNEWSVRMGIGWNASLEEATRHLEAAMKEPTPLAHRVASLMLTIEYRYEEAFTEAQRAIAMDPNDPNGHVAMARILLFAGESEKSLEFVAAAQRLDPESNWLFRIGEAQFQLEHYEDAAAAVGEFTQRNTADYKPYLYLAASYGHLGREGEAKTAYRTLNEVFLSSRSDRDSWRLEQLDDVRIFDKQSAYLLREGLHKAGIGDTRPQVVEASANGITLKKISPESSLQQLYESASEHCQSHGKKSSLSGSSPPSYVFGCY